jgi:hypothetical protein
MALAGAAISVVRPKPDDPAFREIGWHDLGDDLGQLSLGKGL